MSKSKQKQGICADPWKRLLKLRLTVLTSMVSFIAGLLVIFFLVKVYKNLNIHADVLEEIRRNFILLAIKIVIVLTAFIFTNIFLIKLFFEKEYEMRKLSNKAVHDIKNQLYAVITRLDSGDIEYAFEKLQELCSELSSDISNGKHISSTGIKALDVLINSKYAKINDIGIDFSIKSFTSAESSIDDMDLCILIGNALDNAIEACERMKDPAEKWIKLAIMQIENNLSISLVNSSGGEDTGEKHEFVTLKKEKDFHGFGLKKMHEIVNKHEGYIEYYLKNREFHLKILIPNPPK